MLDLYNMAGHLIRRLNQISTSVFADRMKAEGLDLTPVQFGALAALKTHPDVDQATLAGMIAHDRVTMGAVLDRLQNKGLVQRQISPHDRRARVIRLTDAGHAALSRADPIVWALQTDILAGLTPEERTTFLHLLQKATEAGNDLSRAPLHPAADA
ncbi:MarR family winged helix-turn-helix transcriptional regulator [Thalassovita taeanensis]|uniref:DNA-binding transcriptional regulator, MarR family n=1 Tax=Thalassovita taeanensis TaxID=657014 RepID=A0A1H8YRX4_9RHOB|nr:MarR family winged helix-turn-helix transcriptional regulator [Thalassovita taeanensis]SEP54897.1 DNA-binding transcriptional regulator, MarR family [Thalassovita taeanensis]